LKSELDPQPKENVQVDTKDKVQEDKVKGADWKMSVADFAENGCLMNTD